MLKKIILTLICIFNLASCNNAEKPSQEASKWEYKEEQSLLIQNYQNFPETLKIMRQFLLELNPNIEKETNDHKKQALITHTVHDFVRNQNVKNWTWSNVYTRNPILAIQRLLWENTWMCDTWWLINMYAQIAFWYNSRNVTLVRWYWNEIWKPIWDLPSHVLSEVYSEKYKKWYISDSTFDVYFTYKEDTIPLSVWEIFNYIKEDNNNLINWNIKSNYPHGKSTDNLTIEGYFLNALSLYETIFYHNYTENWYTLLYSNLYQGIDKKYEVNLNTK